MNIFFKHLVSKMVKSYSFISQPSPKLIHTRFDIALIKILLAYVSLKLSHLLTLIQVQSHHFLPLLFSPLEPNSSEKPALRKEKSQLQLTSSLTLINYTLLSIFFLSVFSFWFSQTNDTHLLILRSVTEANKTCEVLSHYRIKLFIQLYESQIETGEVK